MIDKEIDLDRNVRKAAFAFLVEQLRQYGRAIPRNVLAKGFSFEGVRVPLVGPQGIFKPKILPEIPISILTVPEIPGKPRPYDDRSTETGIIIYRYRGNDPSHPDNAGLEKLGDTIPIHLISQDLIPCRRGTRTEVNRHSVSLFRRTPISKRDCRPLRRRWSSSFHGRGKRASGRPGAEASLG